MKCIILAAGLGTRMKELTKDTPKPMLLIQNKPKLA
jgi:NDP-sugar pyrophosphorylase family protein